MDEDERPLQKHLMQRVKRAVKDLAKVASIERLRNRINVPHTTNSNSSDEEYMDVRVNEGNENINIPQALENNENEREQEADNEQDATEAFDLSDDEGIFQDEVDQEDDASESSGDDNEDINENHFETEEQKANYVAENLREWAIYEGNISKKKLDNLLHRLNPVFPTLPKSYKTLLRTPKHLDVSVLPDGSMLWYKGIVRNLDAMLLDEYLEKYGNIIIDVNMDGLPIAKSFIVVKFLPTPDDDNVYYEVAVAKWLVEIDEKMMGKLLWPNNNAAVSKLVRVEARADETWQQFDVEVQRYYATYIAARNATKGFEKFASAYESDSGCQMGRGKRKKHINKFSSSDDSSDSDTKTCKQSKSGSKIPATPLPPPLPFPSSLTKSFNVASKENIPTLTVVSNKKQGKTATSNQHKLLHKIVNLRQQAADKAQQRKKAMSLENIRKLTVRKKAVDSTLRSELPIKAFETDGNCKSKPRSSINSSSSLNISEMSTEIRSHSPRSLCRSPSHETLNPCLFTPSTRDYTHQIQPREFEFVENRTETDAESDELSLAPSQPAEKSKQPALTSKVNTDLDKFVIKLDQKIDNMRAKLDMILINQSKLNRILLPETKILSKPPNMPALPLDTMEQVKMFEKFLSNDVNLSDTCYYLKSLPLGNDEARAVPKLMSNLMSNSLAYEFNFDGHGTKLAFKSTKLWELVQGTLLLKFEESDLSEALKSLRSWLRNAKGRKC